MLNDHHLLIDGLHLLIHPTLRATVPSNDPLGKPVGNLLLRALHAVASVADVPPDLDAIRRKRSVGMSLNISLQR